MRLSGISSQSSGGMVSQWGYAVAMSVHCDKSVLVLIWPQMLLGWQTTSKLLFCIPVCSEGVGDVCLHYGTYSSQLSADRSTSTGDWTKLVSIFCFLATSKVTSGQVPICDSAQSCRLYNFAPFWMQCCWHYCPIINSITLYWLCANKFLPWPI